MSWRETLLFPIYYTVVLADVFFNIKPESNGKIQNDRRPQGEKTEVNKIQTNLGIGYSQPLTNIGTHTKY
jgi:hypothetical protein